MKRMFIALFAILMIMGIGCNKKKDFSDLREVIWKEKQNLSAEQMIDVFKASNHDPFVAETIVLTGKLSVEQMFEVFKASDYDPFVATAIEKKIKLDTLSVELMIDVFKMSDNDDNIAYTIVRTGKLSVEQMYKVLKISDNNPFVAQTIFENLQKIPVLK